MRLPILAAAALALAAPAAGAQPAAAAAPAAPQAADQVDTALLARLRAEALDRSQVMQTASWLTDVHGPRLTGSPQLGAAAAWAEQALRGWGVSRVYREAWGPFARGWVNEGFALSVVAPTHYPVIAYPRPWTPGTPGVVRGQPVPVRIDSAADFARYRGRLRGRIVLLGEALPTLPPHVRPDARRYADSTLARIAADTAGDGPPFRSLQQFLAALPPQVRALLRLRAEQLRFLADEGAAAALIRGPGDDGTVFVDTRDFGAWFDTAAARRAPPTAVLASEHFGRMARAVERGAPVTVELDARNRFVDGAPNAFNLLAELPGTDPALRDEVVMLGAHFDSWAAGTGATDNGAGSAVVLEAMRVLKASGVPLRRTVRLALWTGEEQGLLGSLAYVRRHFGDPETGRPGTPAQAAENRRVAAYFNLDNGTGRIRGVYAQGNAAVRPVFDAWLAPFRAGGAGTTTLAPTGGTDHEAFDDVGIPGFQFIQDPLDYDARTHHSNMDVYERLQPDDMRWNALVVATFVMQAANRPAPLPRKPAAAEAAHGGR